MSYNIYQDNILDYSQNPRNKGTIENPDLHFRDVNPLCGDELEFFVKLDKNNKITDVKFQGSGCAISQAAASMVTEELMGKTLKDLINYDKKRILKLLGIEISPAREKCAFLSLRVLKLAAYSKLGKKELELKEKLDEEGLGY